jgi:hypothetical protein
MCTCGMPASMACSCQRTKCCSGSEGEQQQRHAPCCCLTQAMLTLQLHVALRRHQVGFALKHAHQQAAAVTCKWQQSAPVLQEGSSVHLSCKRATGADVHLSHTGPWHCLRILYFCDHALNLVLNLCAHHLQRLQHAMGPLAAAVRG